MKREKIITNWWMMIVILMALAANAPGQIYVDVSATGANNGSSWDDAYIYLQDALDVAIAGDEIWVAQGIYRPDQGVSQVPGDRDSTFQLISGVTLYGGFGGETVLNGDLSGDDETGGDNSENSYHVITGSGADETALLESFVIEAGNASELDYSFLSLGGGMFSNDGSPTVNHCVFRKNHASGYGGAVYNRNSSSEFNHCVFDYNACDGIFAPGYGYVSWGGAMRNWHSSTKLYNCTFSNNRANNWSGGAIHNFASSPELINCKFIDNTALFGGGMSNDTDSSPLVLNCEFKGNSAWIGGGFVNYFKSKPRLLNCVFKGNSASGTGGGMVNLKESYPTLINCTFVANSASLGNALGFDMFNPVEDGPSSADLYNCILWDGGNEIGFNDTSTVNVYYSNVQGGWFGMGNIDQDPMFIYSPLDGIGGNYHLLPGSPCIDTGANEPPGGLAVTDKDGNLRMLDGDNDKIAVVDMGAFEFARNSFVTGGGWIYSPLGASAEFPDAEGKANFGFNVKFKKRSSTPDGNTLFNFKMGDLKFQSRSYDWLVVAGNKAIFTGTGAIKDKKGKFKFRPQKNKKKPRRLTPAFADIMEGDIKFMLMAVDGGKEDRFRIKIWYVEEGLDVIIYDNMSGEDIDTDLDDSTILGGGSIVIHSKK
ncbi:MAG: right-handed parallel beta-helix repeat-containing protein [Planctomycetes bacterium]|nr:right-handed parallel beta-helix repeat-containing protein [Planctomycetota bacterium]